LANPKLLSKLLTTRAATHVISDVFLLLCACNSLTAAVADQRRRIRRVVVMATAAASRSREA